MPFLSRRHIDPLTLTPPPRDNFFSRRPSSLTLVPRSRVRSEPSLFRRVSALFTVRRRAPSKTSALHPCASPPRDEHGHAHPWPILPRVSGDSTSESSLEIRRPSGLGRRASLLESNDSVPDSESFERVSLAEATAGPTRYANLPNLLSGEVHLPGRMTYTSSELPRTRPAASFPLPEPILRVVLEFLPRNDLVVVALVSCGFCASARHALYRSLDVQTLAESSLEKLYDVLAMKQELAALVISFHCRSLPSWELASPDGQISSIPLNHVRRALQNMHNLKVLTLASFASILSLTPSLVFSLSRLTILDKRMTQSQFVAMCGWLATQPSLESLSFPHLVRCTSAHPLSPDEWTSASDPSRTNGCGSFNPILPGLKWLRASTETVYMLCCAMHSPIEHITLDVHETLYMGLRPGSVIRSLGCVRHMHIIFGAEVDKRTVEKFLALTGSMLTGEDDAEAMKSLEVEVLWTGDDAAETLYGIVTAIISRFRGLETLKLTSPFRSIQAPIPPALDASLLHPPTPPSLSWTSASSMFPSDHSDPPPDCGSWVRREFIACGVEKKYAKTWTRRCPSLSDIQFDFSSATADADVELCGVWFRRKMPPTLLSMA